MYHAIRSGWTNQITRLFIPTETKTAKNANHGSAYIHTPLQQSNPPQMWPELLCSVLSLTRIKNDGTMSPTCCHFSPTQIFGIYSLLCISQPFSFWFPIIRVVAFKQISHYCFLSAVVPSFLAVVVVKCVCTVGIFLARLHRGGHPRRAFDRNLEYP